MDKDMFKKIIVNNIIFFIIEIVFLSLILTGTFDSLMSPNNGAMVSFDLQFFLISHLIVIAILVVIGYKRYNNDKTDIVRLTKYYLLSFATLILVITFFLSYPKYSPMFVITYAILIFSLISFAVSLVISYFHKTKNVSKR